MGALGENLLHLRGFPALTLVFLLPALEASVFVGIVFPGEIAVLLGGVLAFERRVGLVAVLVAAVLGAAVGDQVGYVVGRRYGEWMLRKLPNRLLDEERLQGARATIRRLGAKAVIAGRWTAALRALVPGLAGMSGMHYWRFTVANVLGGAGWAVTFVLLGYVAGNGWRRVHRIAGTWSVVLLAVVVVAGVAVLVVRRRRSRSRQPVE